MTISNTTAPPDYFKMAVNWLLDRAQSDKELDALFPPGLPFPDAWYEALAQEFAEAISDCGGEWVETLIAGRPYDTSLVEWAHRELDKAHEDCIPVDDVKEAAQEGTRW